ncbi:helix-turn-helix domain-containing protein [Curtobacterium sp. VKM Ac-1395]|nr:helix-turn-helix domain-containing protein [Curtobacterium sp. VKM Ac-1395]
MDAEARWRILRLHVEDQISLTALARESGVPLRTLAGWLARYRKAGAAGLDTSRRSDSGQRHTPPELIRLIEGLALSRPRPSVATLHRLVAERAANEGTTAPSYSTVRRIIQGLDPAMITLALDGPTSYRDKHELVLRRRANRPNHVWQADHTMLDIVIRGADGAHGGRHPFSE